jgi:bifunctional non-homologous end joining protein LigD
VPDRLGDYQRKRDFARTPEPKAPPQRARRGRPRLPRFVVQEHHARRLHWDLRLEHDGTLASWAVPNGIPDHPDRNRKAIRTEDHPLSYLEFEGDIPEGEYGAGRMIVWDTGTYEEVKFREDEVIATFHGERLRGRYALFRTDGRDWMIHRMDPPADPEGEPMPERLVPMLARPGALPPDDRKWAYEVKWDGVRALLYWEPGSLRLESRNLNDITTQYPEVRALSRELGSRRAVLDGELVAFGEDGRPSFGRLQQRMHLASPAAAARRSRQVPVTYVIFDLLYLDGRTLCARPYRERRAALEDLGLDGPAWRTPRHHVGDGRAMLEASGRQGLEGVVAKRLGSRYEPGRRSGAWLKIKHIRRQEMVIGGWARGQGRRRERIGALLVGHHDATPAQARARDEPQRLIYAGKVGTGFTERELERLQRRLEPLERATSPFARGVPRAAAPPRGSVFVEPALVAEVEFREWTSDGCLRAPSYKGLRADRDPLTVVREDKPASGDHGAAPAVRPLRRVRGGEEVEVDGRRMKLTNLEKVLYPATGFTKGDLIEYLRLCADALLPHLRDRPLTLKRYPDGVEGEHFYEKQCPGHRPDWVSTATIPRSRGEQRSIDFCLANDLPTLVWLGNLADLELHTSLSLAADIERPTMLVFDLDPGPPAGVLECAEVALRLRGLFAHLGLQTLVKTSGSKGLQAYVPLNTPITYDDTKPFARAVAELLAKQHPERVVSRMTKELRGGKVFVDWSQNDRHKTTVCVYSPREGRRPMVSTPVAWEEVEEALSRRRPQLLTFDTAQVLERVAERGDLFAPALTLAQELPRLDRNG